MNAETAKQMADKFQFVAVIFMGLDNNYSLHSVSKEVYIYFDPFGLQVKDYALIHNGTQFGLVKVMRTIPLTDTIAAKNVSKSILSRIDYDEELIVSCQSRINELKSSQDELAIQAEIDRRLGLKPDGTPTEERKRALSLQISHNPDFSVDDDNDSE